MKPVKFTCVETLNLTPERIAEEILDASKWLSFKGYGPLPGIASAEFEKRTPAVVGSRMRVVNTDRSTHVEEFVDWRPGERLQLNMQEFSPPFSRLATKVEEVWTFERISAATRATRTLSMHPKSALTRPFVWLLSFLLKRAIQRHLLAMRE
ncbi:MAG TPA: SRPBCC family protein [Pirellulales bacterium]